MADVNSTLSALIRVCDDIAQELQSKLSTTSKFKPVEYATIISGIGAEANAKASDIKLDKKVYVGNDYIVGTFEGVDLNVTLSDEDQTFEPQSGKYYKKVVVPAGSATTADIWDGTGVEIQQTT